MSVQVKICGVNTLEALKACIDHDANFIGLNFYPPSPRSLSVDLARELFAATPEKISIVGVFVDPTDEEMDHVLSEVPLDIIQLHGNETPDFIDSIKLNYQLPVIKALSLHEKKDLEQIAKYNDVVDWFLFDSKPPKNVASLPGGNALSFDWTILKDAEVARPWFLAGGLHADNIADALARSGAQMVDTASGVEDRPGFKNPDKIKQFLAASRAH